MRCLPVLQIKGDSVSERLLSSHVGMTSSAEDLSAVLDRSRVTSSTVTGVSVFSWRSTGTEGGNAPYADVIC